MDKIITLNVRGQLFTTLTSTLTLASPFFKSLLGEQFSKPLTDEKGRIFINRNPKYFNIILNYLITSKLDQSETFDMKLLLEEFEYYGIALDITVKEEITNYLSLQESGTSMEIYTNDKELKGNLKSHWNKIKEDSTTSYNDDVITFLDIIHNEFHYKIIGFVNLTEDDRKYLLEKTQ